MFDHSGQALLHRVPGSGGGGEYSTKFYTEGGVGEYSTKFYTGSPEVQTPYPYTIFHRIGSPFLTAVCTVFRYE